LKVSLIAGALAFIIRYVLAKKNQKTYSKNKHESTYGSGALVSAPVLLALERSI